MIKSNEEVFEYLDTLRDSGVTNFAEMVCESYQSKMLTDIDAQMLANPELITPADEAQLNRLDKLLVDVIPLNNPIIKHEVKRND